MLFFFTPELHLWLLIALLQLEYPIKIEFVSTFGYVFELEQFERWLSVQASSPLSTFNSSHSFWQSLYMSLSLRCSVLKQNPTHFFRLILSAQLMKQVEFMYLVTLVGLLCPQGRLVKQMCVLCWINLKRRLGLFSEMWQKAFSSWEVSCNRTYVKNCSVWSSLK